MTTGRIAPELARNWASPAWPGGPAAWPRTCAATTPFAPIRRTAHRQACHAAGQGDVAARVAVRFDEVMRSLAADSRTSCAGCRWARCRCECTCRQQPAKGAGWVEGWRGEVFVALQLGADGHHILRCHLHDPSWQNWPVLEHAIMNDIVADFPLINKSFNLSYSGHDL
jgi:Ni,Fe-hydrogenase III large subunit